MTTNDLAREDNLLTGWKVLRRHNTRLYSIFTFGWGYGSRQIPQLVKAHSIVEYPVNSWVSRHKGWGGLTLFSTLEAAEDFYTFYCQRGRIRVIYRAEYIPAAPKFQKLSGLTRGKTVVRAEISAPTGTVFAEKVKLVWWETEHTDDED